jgi:hypothetical protein
MAKNVTIKVKINTKDGVKTVGDLNEEFEQTLNTMGELEEASSNINEALKGAKFGTEEYAALSQELIKVNTELKNQELALEALDNEQVASEIKSVTGGLTDMAGGLALVGASGKSMEQLVQTFAMVEGASKIVTGGMEGWLSTQKLLNNAAIKGAEGNKFLAASQKMAAIQAKAAAVAMRILNFVMNLNPVFLIIAGIMALIAALAWFVTSNNDAADAAAKLNDQLDRQNQLNEALRVSRANAIQVQTSGLKAQKKVLEAEKASLEAKEKLTAAEKDRIKTIEDSITSLEKQEAQIIKKESIKQLTEDTNQIKTQFALIKESIAAVEHEDAGFDDINYSKAKNELNGIKNEFNSIEQSFKNTGDIDAYQASLNKLGTRAANASSQFAILGKKLEGDEKDLWDDVNQGAKDLTSNIQGLDKATADLISTQNEASAEDAVAEIQDADKAAADAEKRRQAAEKAYQAWLQKRKELLNDITDILKREEAAQRELQKVKIGLIKDEVIQREAQINDAYGSARDKLIDGAIKREEAKLQEKFVKGKLDEAEYRAALQTLAENGADYLLDVEVKLLEEKKKVRDGELNELRQFAQRKVLLEIATLEELDVVKREKAQMELDMRMNAELNAATNTITNEEALQEELLRIRQSYKDEQMASINSMLAEEKQLRKAQYESDVRAKGTTDEEKRLLQAQYDRDIVALEKTAQEDIQALNVETSVAVAETLAGRIDEWMGKWGGVVQFAFDSVSQAMDIAQQALDELAEREAGAREAAYESDVESLNQSLANKSMSQEQFTQAMEELEQNKAAKELQAKKKAFKISKGMQITSAIMQTAQAVLAAFSSAAAIPMAGVALGPIMAGVAGALGAAQIAVIASQQFRAARGGVVPGAASMTDSVNSLLAPGEMVINSNSAGMFPELLSSINQAGGGIQLAPDRVEKSTMNSERPVYGDNMSQQPIKAYVVENEVTEKQKKITRIEKSAEFG